MSKIIISAAIRGAHNIVGKAAAKLDAAIQKYGENQEIGFPNTAYYLPIIYSLMGTKIEKLKDAVPVMARCKALLPPVPAEHNYLPYLGPGLDAGLATLFAEEISEAIRYVEDPDFYVGGEEVYSKGDTKIWLGRRGRHHLPETGRRVRRRLRPGVRRHRRRRPLGAGSRGPGNGISEEEPLHLLRRQVH